MSEWIHSICYKCWIDKFKATIPYKRKNDVEEQKCCWCGDWHISGIYFRENQTVLRCEGNHE